MRCKGEGVRGLGDRVEANVPIYSDHISHTHWYQCVIHVWQNQRLQSVEDTKWGTLLGRDIHMGAISVSKSVILLLIAMVIVCTGHNFIKLLSRKFCSALQNPLPGKK